ncbi:reticulocalbin-1-like protein [Cricetulus griseus]|nr:reticulocalbin-1-like protein [Cricetulus griseus]
MDIITDPSCSTTLDPDMVLSSSSALDSTMAPCDSTGHSNQSAAQTSRHQYDHRKGIEFFTIESTISVKVSIVVKRYHDHSNSYEGKHLTKAVLRFQTFNPLPSCKKIILHVNPRSLSLLSSPAPPTNALPIPYPFCSPESMTLSIGGGLQCLSYSFG